MLTQTYAPDRHTIEARDEDAPTRTPVVLLAPRRVDVVCPFGQPPIELFYVRRQELPRVFVGGTDCGDSDHVSTHNVTKKAAAAG